MKAVYAGSFDPITLGHVSVIERAFQLFSEIHIIVANNRSKKHYFTIEQRTELVALSILRRICKCLSTWSSFICH